MPRKKLSMRKTTEVLRLHAEGLSQRQIAVSTGVGKTTVLEYLARAKEAGISWPLPEGMDGEALDAALFPAVAAEVAERASRHLASPQYWPWAPEFTVALANIRGVRLTG